MTRIHFRARTVCGLAATALAVVLVWPTDAAFAQSQPSSGGLLDRIFGSDRNSGARPPGQAAQADPSNLLVRIDRLETQIRQLTGVVEQLQYQNQQLAEQIRRMQEDNEFRFQELGAKGPPTGRPQRQPARTPPTASPAVPAAPAAIPGKRSDVFDPAQHPNAPGAPKVLGPAGSAQLANPPPVIAAEPPPQSGEGEPLIGAPGGRNAGAPLDLSTLAERLNNPPPAAAGNQLPSAPGQLPPPPPRNTSATGARLAAVEPPSQSPKDLYDLAYGYVLRKDYALAADAFQRFIGSYPSDQHAPEAQYWLGESMFQRQRFRDAAEAFLTVSTKYETTAKAPDALLRLGQSLAALGEKEAACASLAEIKRKFPRASNNVKRGVTREQKRVGC
jgi:tol-pal system protein YbgF